MEEKITLFLVEVGILEDKAQAKKEEEYIPAYDEQFHYWDENFIVFMGSEEAVCYALGYVINGKINTYAVCKELQVPQEWVSEDDIRDRYLSDTGLDENGGKAYDLGNQTVTARLQNDLSF